MDSFTIKGPFNDIQMELYNATPAAKSRIFIPISSGSGDLSGYTYASFKTYGKNQEKTIKKSKNKINISIDASMNDLAEMHIVLDPTTGDEIAAKGNGRISLEIPPNNDIRMTGVYTIDNGTYTYTYKKLFITKQFQLQSGSTVSFNGPFASTTVNVDATYAVKARLADILSDADQTALSGPEAIDAKTPQEVDVKVKMTGYLAKPTLTFDIGLEDSHSQGTIAYRRLMLINSDPQQQVEEVSALLLVGFFITPDVIGGATVQSGAINSLGQALSSTTSNTLTNLVNKITGNKDFSVAVKYTNYNYNDPSSLSTANRNTLYGGIGWNYFNKRLNVEVGSTSDWGKPTSASSTSNFNITGDFRIQYQVAENSGIRVSAFRTSDYDVTLDRDITRSGVGIGWHKSFDNFDEFFHGNKYAAKQKIELLKKVKAEEAADTTSSKKPSGTE